MFRKVISQKENSRFLKAPTRLSNIFRSGSNRGAMAETIGSVVSTRSQSDVRVRGCESRRHDARSIKMVEPPYGFIAGVEARRG
jgi:hypothetical protein